MRKQNLIKKVAHIFGYEPNNNYMDIFFIGGSKCKKVEVTNNDIRIDATVTLEQLAKIKEVLDS